MVGWLPRRAASRRLVKPQAEERGRFRSKRLIGTTLWPPRQRVLCLSTLRSRFAVLGVAGRCGRCSRPGAGRFVPNTSSANGGSLRWSRARRSAPATRCWRRRSWRSGKVSRRAPPASRARRCPIGPARRGNCATAATGAGVPACVGGASTNRPRPSSPAAFRGRSGCRGAAADTPPPASAQSPRRGVGRGQGTRSSREVKPPSQSEPAPLPTVGPRRNTTVRRNPQCNSEPQASTRGPSGQGRWIHPTFAPGAPSILLPKRFKKS